MPVYSKNRIAYRLYNIEEKFETGIKLQGHEVKAIKEGQGHLKGSYVKFMNNKLLLIGFNLQKYSKAGVLFEYDPTRDRELLLHKKELNYFRGKIEKQGYTAVPLKLYSKGSIIKLEVGIAKGRKKAERKDQIIKKQQDLETRRLSKETYQNRG